MKYAARVCRPVILAATFLASSAAAPAPKVHPRPYGRGTAVIQTTAIAPYTFDNTVLTLHFDFAKAVVYGVETVTIHPRADGLGVVPFDSIGMSYSAVTVNGQPAQYHVDASHLYVTLAQPANASDALTIAATYTTTPTRGIYFIRPDRYYPNMQPEIWSQGEAIDNRRWFPTWDEPNDKTPVEQIVTVPKAWEVTANGSLKSMTDNADGTATWDWVMQKPISTYLIAFSAGPYVHFHTTTQRPDGTPIPVDYFTSAADAKWATPCFGNTHDIVAFFQKTIGITYPWPKYDQTTVERFTAGGMENASATTQTELAIHPPSYDLTNSCNGLVAHELSHQWWGDDVTMADWANVWINEGYATYFQELWSQHHYGEAEFEYERYHAQDSYFNETKRYWRPIVDYVYSSPLDSFDASGYPRPGQVLHMLRYMEGDARFFKALRDYLGQYEGKNADTAQFFTAIDASLGENLDWFQKEWFYRAAFPHYFVKQSYNPKAKTLTLDVTQRAHDGSPFRMPVVVSVYVGGAGRNFRFTDDRAHQTVTIPGVAAQPQMVLFDPNNSIIRQLDYAKSTQGLGYQALHAPYVSDRLWAVAALGRAVGNDRILARQFVRDVVGHDPFYGVRADALDAAASLDDAGTIDFALRDSDPRVKIAAANDVGELDHPTDKRLVADLGMMTRNPNPVVSGAAYAGLGATKTPGSYALLLAGLRRHAFREPIIRGAIAGLQAFGDSKAIAVILPFAQYGADETVRPVAIAAIGALGHKKPSAVQATLVTIAQRDPYFRARGAAVRALGMLGQRSAIPALLAIEHNDTEESIQNAAWDAIAAIKDSKH
ncbi:MAG TPA: M1 family aminopeptidase [Verrucomicrobiae bacterium]|jgi:aminopeptidase N|nr:M1 family aminopeptidase [Verrucomicrobiae bacterium]